MNITSNKRATTTIAAILAGVTISLTSACSTSDSETMPETAQAAQVTMQDRNQAFLLSIGNRFPGVDDDLMISTGKSTFEALDSGATMLDVAKVAIRNLGEEGAYFVGASVGAFCPEYSGDIDALVGE